MLEYVLRFSIERRGLVLLVVAAVALLGVRSFSVLPIDAVPDVTNRQVQINAIAAALSPVEVERQITFPVETALAGIPGLVSTRSLSRNGYAQITAVFGDDVDIYFARQQVAERLAAVADGLPPDAAVRMGPTSSGLGEVYIWTVEYEHPRGAGAPLHDGENGWQADGSYRTPEGELLRGDVELTAYLRTVQDWIIRPQLTTVPGVAGIDVLGGFVKQVQVQPDPQTLAAFGLTFLDLIRALERNNLSTGAGYIEHNGESYIVRAEGRLTDRAEISEIVVAERDGTPLRIADVARVAIGGALRGGSASEDGEEVVIGTALMLLGENSRRVAAAVDARVKGVAASLPRGVRVKTVLDRSQLVDATIRTVRDNLVEGALLVIAVLFLMLGNLRAALIASSAIPLSMLFAAIGMVQTRTSGNLMSLGAIDFGLIVDGAIIIVENCLRGLGERQRELGRVLTAEERLRTVFLASKEVRGATAFGEAIIITVYIPVLALSGVEGKMFQPMALTVIFALAAAFVLSLTFVPAMVALCVTGAVRERENRPMLWLTRQYRSALRVALRWRAALVASAAAVLFASLLLFRSLGQEFAPTLSELDLLVHAIRIPSTGVSQATEMQRTLERSLRAVPEIALVFSRTGTGDAGSDPMPPYVSDTFMILRPRAEWPDPGDTKADVRERVEAVLQSLPGNAYEFTQPIQMRFNELLAGVRADLAVKVFGDEYDALLPVAERIAEVLRAVPGAADTSVEQVTGVPVLSLQVDRRAIAPYGLSVADVHEVATIATAGRVAGQIFQGDRRFDLVVRLAEADRADLAVLENLPVSLAHEHDSPVTLALGGEDPRRTPARYLPLSAVAKFVLEEGPNQISRENGKRRIMVQSNVRGRDIGSFVAEAQRRVAAEIDLPAGSWLAWGGQFEQLVDAKRRLAVVVPLCFVVILALLYATFGAVRPAAVVFSGVPLALTGGIVALWLRGMPFSISAAVGFIALSGVAVLNGLVMTTFIERLRRAGVEVAEAVIRGATMRLRPVLMTALVASLGFLPMALGTGTGAEVQRPLATVVIGGLISSTALTLLVLPALYTWMAEGRRG
jgi:cobalt-zinc-cadmium resistance protein CzcA